MPRTIANPHKNTKHSQAQPLQTQANKEKQVKERGARETAQARKIPHKMLRLPSLESPSCKSPSCKLFASSPSFSFSLYSSLLSPSFLFPFLLPVFSVPLSLFSAVFCSLFLLLGFSLSYAKEGAGTPAHTPSQAELDSSLESSASPASPKDKHIVGGIAIKVNNDPITLYEIQSLSSKEHISKDKAQEFLIAQRLKAQEIKRLNIITDDARLDQEISTIAAQNHLSHQQFLQALYQQGITLESYKEKLKDQIQTRELMRNILLSSNTSSEETIRKYYNDHKSEFLAARSIRALRYNAKDPRLLERSIANKNLNLKGVEKTPETLTLSALNPQIAQMFSQLQVGEFSPILDAGNGSYVTFLVQEKNGEEYMSFDEAKNLIAQKLAQEQQEQILSEYFEKIRQQARIEYVRK